MSVPICYRCVRVSLVRAPRSVDIGTDIWHIGSHVVPMSTDIGTDMSVGICILWGRLAMSVDIGNRHFDRSLLGPGTRARGPRGQGPFF